MFDKEFLDDFMRAQKEWEQGPLKVSLEQEGERQNDFQTYSGLPLKRLYTPLDLYERDINPISGIGFPGEFPFVRGIEPTMYRKKIWERVQYSGFGLPEDTNKRIRYILDQGQTGFYIALDLPTQMGIDSDHPSSMGEVGRVGVAICSLSDMEKIFEGIPLSSVSQIRTTAMAIGPIMLAMFLALAEKQGVSPTSFTVRLQNDVLKEFDARGTCIFPVKPSLKFSVDTIEYCARFLPNWSSMSVAGTHMRLAGATAVQELAFTMANAIAYIEATIARGLDVDDFSPQFQCLFSVNTMDFFEEIAKLRAVRKMWARILSERFHAKNPESLRAKLNSFASGLVSTAQEPLNNIMRIGIEALAIALGGAQDVGVSSYDEPICTPSEEAARVALRTSQIIAYETGVTNVVDPLGGSYYLESLTDELVKQAFQLLAKIEELGGSVAAIEKGFYQDAITRSAYLDQKRVEKGERVIVGVNKFVSPERIRLKPFVIDPEVERKQIDRLREFKGNRDHDKLTRALQEVSEAARQNENTVPSIFKAVKANATIGEICDALRIVWGEWVPETVGM